MANKGSFKSPEKSQHKSQKINLQQSYPCPLCRGKLDPITLTDAAGCDRCHSIFEVEKDGYGMTQVEAARIWYWWGDRWKQSSKIFKENQTEPQRGNESQHYQEFAFFRIILILSSAILLCLLVKAPEFILGFTILILLLLIIWRFLPHNF